MVFFALGGVGGTKKDAELETKIPFLFFPSPRPRKRKKKPPSPLSPFALDPPPSFPPKTIRTAKTVDSTKRKNGLLLFLSVFPPPVSSTFFFPSFFEVQQVLKKISDFIFSRAIDNPYPVFEPPPSPPLRQPTSFFCKENIFHEKENRGEKNEAFFVFTSALLIFI